MNASTNPDTITASRASEPAPAAITQPVFTPPTVLQTFQGLGMFAAKDLHKDTITLPDGKSAEFYVRELPDAEFRTLWADGDRAKLIAATIRDADGNAVMTVTEAAQLKPLIAAQLQTIAMKHSGFGADAETVQAEAGNA